MYIKSDLLSPLLLFVIHEAVSDLSLTSDFKLHLLSCLHLDLT